jgi:hypothetical protein
MIAADYARAAAYLSPAQQPAYVSFVEQASARGMGSDDEAPQRIYVRTSDGAIMSGEPPANVHVIHTSNGDGDSPFGKHAFFKPQCYVPQGEDQTRWNGEPALRFKLQATCSDDIGMSELYVDPITFRPIAADGTMADTGEDHMNVAIELRYATVGQYTVPSSVRAHAVGHGWLFWARERVEVDYTDYAFYPNEQVMRRQAAKPL